MEAVDGDVAIAAIGLGLVKREAGVKVTAASIVVNDYVFTSGECFGVEVLHGGAVIGWFVPRVNSWLAIDHSASSPFLVSSVKNGKSCCYFGAICRLGVAVGSGGVDIFRITGILPLRNFIFFDEPGNGLLSDAY